MPADTATRPMTRLGVIGSHFNNDETDLRLFTTIATLGTPQDVTLQELRVECFSRSMTSLMRAKLSL
jgi:hypothetical protein